MEQTMKATTKSAEDVGHGESLEQVKERFALWRQGRKRGERISSALWAAAVGLAEQHGVELSNFGGKTPPVFGIMAPL